jgi:oxalate decarboxylase
LLVDPKGQQQKRVRSACHAAILDAALAQKRHPQDGVILMSLSRRDLVALGAVAGASVVATAGRAASFGNPDEPAEGVINAKNPASATDPGPQDPAIRDQLPSAFSPPATDVGGMPQIWASFNTAPRRVQNGGWARQVTKEDFPISTTIAGVNMRLTAGGIRELHWHQAAEWAYMTYGNCRVTVVDAEGRPYVADVKEGDIWYFPAGYPHSLQGLEPDGCEFVICFDNGAASEFNTLLVTDWFAHTPPAVLGDNFGAPAETFQNIPLHNRWIFQGKVPGDLSSVRTAVIGDFVAAPSPFTFPLASAPYITQTKGGMLQLADSRTFAVSATIAAVVQTIRPGGLRQMHWHPNADEWQYYIKGKARMGVFNTGPNVVTMDFNPGDIGYVPRNYGHYVQNIGDTDMQFFAVFRTSRFEEFSLSQWLRHSPAELVAEHLNVDPTIVSNWPGLRAAVMPE